ncbi:MAG: bifunctional hydroxymethylpyrimidine kinase/phosphomethylpyrimidine kinase [Cardiobacteriaceae bacterium]|nr:bifunctional hydroxymethylpyrimidine kinase/phosphomethylpyrimidine kinase [Cardiobacteriaceae bacterium]
MEKKIYSALTIAGSDSGGGAGIQADIKTMHSRGVFATSVITAITAQNTLGVQAVHCVPCDIIAAQIDSLADDDFNIRAFKIGMLGTAEIIETVAAKLRQIGGKFGSCVLDPVMIAKGGAPLLEKDAVSALKRELLPLAKVITPNLPELKELTGITVESDKDAETAAKILQDAGVEAVVIKGGHGETQICRDRVFTSDANFVLENSRIDTRHTHGTGCTFSACIAAELAKGADLTMAIKTANQGIYAAIANSPAIGKGQGGVNHWEFQKI